MNAATDRHPITQEQQAAILNSEVARLAAQGWTVGSVSGGQGSGFMCGPR